MNKIEEKTIGNLHLRMAPLLYTQMTALSVRLVRVGGPTLAALFDGAPVVEGQASVKDIEMSSVKAAMTELALRLDTHDLEFVIDTLASVTTLRTERGGWVALSDEERSLLFGGGRFFTAAKFIVWGLQVQYADFLAELGGDVLVDAVKASLKSKSPSTSIGSSGESSRAIE